MIPTLRHVQAERQLAAIANRRVGAVGGSNANNSNVGFVTGIGVAWSTIVSQTIVIPGQAMDLLVWAALNFNRTAGTIGETFFGEIIKDSDPDNSHLNFPIDASYQSVSVPNDQLSRGLVLIAKYIGLPGGNHTFLVRGSATGSTFQATATIDLVTVMAMTRP